MRFAVRSIALAILLFGLMVAPASAGEATKNSTQPGDIVDKLEAPAACADCHASVYKDWSGSMMGNDFYDPSFLAALSIAEQDAPGVGDYCLRCHAVGWFEGKSETPGGDTLGKSFLPAPAVDRESVPVCDLCHRLERVGLRKSRVDGAEIAEGNGSVYFSVKDPWKGGKHPLKPLHKTSELCGSCHDVSNPLLASGNDSSMRQPLERTYTEWKFSFFGETGFRCQQCHPPMKFPGAQTWLLYPGMSSLYGDVDAWWAKAGFKVTPSRAFALRAARERNEQLMRQAADVEILEPPELRLGNDFEVRVRVTNRTGHKLPTGFAEGRQLWLHLRVTDADGKLVFEDGRLDESGALVRTDQTKVYEQKAAVEGKKSFHFAKLDEILKDNRIPARGFDKEAYEKEGAFIIGADYEDGQNWDVTPFIFNVPPDVRGPLTIKARLKYETYSKEYMDWLRATDKTKTANAGGPAAAAPDGSDTWGEVTYKLWKKYGRGRPTVIAGADRVVKAAASATTWNDVFLILLVGLGAAGLAGRVLRAVRPTD